MLVRSLGSGSSGNCTVVAHNGRAILIDAGISRRRILKGLEGLDLKGIVITHAHGDHLGGAVARLEVPVWLDKTNAAEGERRGKLDGRVQVFGARPFTVGPFRIDAFPVPHPGETTWGCHGFRVTCGRKSFGYATDLGRVPNEAIEGLGGADAVFLESNHDLDLQLSSGRHPSLISWVTSDHGHLSNDQCAEALGRIGSPDTVILGHLSEECNRPELAREAAEYVLPASTRVLVTGRRGLEEDVRF